ncbi:MAG: GNAT family N-acetyltransferase [Spirulina sp. SIO3F2]|nr:GNAT family N-acetyltransferase [Spirulina sp. SIO3F2]
MAIEIRVLGPKDKNILRNIAPEVFDNPIDPALTEEFLADPRHHLVVALDGETVVGMASAIDYVHPDKPVALWINEVGVSPAYRRQGIGQRLVQTILALGRELGCEDAWLAAEASNVAANGLYTSAGGKPGLVVMYTFKLAND